MSVNITVHAAAPEAHPDPFASLESVRKADSDKRRRARLEQVRQQSKELAAKVRRNFKTAKQKELANVEKIKQEELKRWKQKNISQLQSEYQFCLEDVVVVQSVRRGERVGVVVQCVWAGAGGVV